MWTFPPIDHNFKEWLQALSWAGAALGVVVATVKFWSELRLGRLQRDHDLRWRQAVAGKALNDEMQTDERAWPALQMPDSIKRDYPVSASETVSVDHAEVSAYLSKYNLWRTRAYLERYELWRTKQGLNGRPPASA